MNRATSTTTGLRLQIALRAAGISQAEFARQLGVSRAWVHDLMAGRARPSPDFVRKAPIILGSRLDIDPGDLRRSLFQVEPEVSS
jgi:transcriptional regulator with XRE-family HTH domain